MYDIVVVGGGLVGSAFALDLAKQAPHLNICVIDKAILGTISADYDSRIYAINPSNLDYLSDLGISLDYARINTIQQMLVHGDDNSAITLDAGEINQDYLAKTVEYQNLQNSLINELLTYPNVNMINALISKIDNHSTHVELLISHDNVETVIKSKLLVASDGANSFVRNYFNVPVSEIDYLQSGVIANLKTEFPHDNVANQWFLSGGDILAFLPLPNNCISIVYSTHDPKAVVELPEKELEDLLYNLSQGKLGRLSLLSKPIALPIKLKLVEKFYLQNIAFIGDAAHTIHPLAGQGVNLGFQDAKYLANLLATTKAYQYNDIGLLEKYHNHRYLSVRKMQLICHGLYRLFNADNSALVKLRNFGLKLINNTTIIKKNMIKQAI